MLHGIIDIGSNTIRMAIYSVECGKVELLTKKKHTVGLAAYIKENIMQKEGIEKTCAVLLEFKLFLTAHEISNISTFSAAALRNITNSRAAVEEIKARTGLDLMVMSGDKEAQFGFIGAMRTSQLKEGILIDIGGASTELVVYQNNQILYMTSLPVGSLAMHTKYVSGLLPNKVEAAQITSEVLRQVAMVKVFEGNTFLDICGIGGTFKGTCQLHNALDDLPEGNHKIPVSHLTEMINGFVVDDKEREGAVFDLLLKFVPEREKSIIPGMIIAGALATNFCSAMITYSNSGVREGYLYDQVIN